MQKKLLAVVVPLAAGVLVAGCGGSDNSSSTDTSAGAKVKSTAQKTKSNSAAGNSSTLSLSADPIRGAQVQQEGALHQVGRGHDQHEEPGQHSARDRR